jgi:chorismate mutase/prephenate dehydratase
MKLDECRKVIDAIDTEILALLNRRANLSRRMGQIKLRAGLPILDEQREEMVLRRLMRDSEGDISDAALTNIYREILEESRRIQRGVTKEIISSGELTK